MTSVKWQKRLLNKREKSYSLKKADVPGLYDRERRIENKGELRLWKAKGNAQNPDEL
jgi:hypothetical protein